MAERKSLLIPSKEYVNLREKYSYGSPDCIFDIIQTGQLIYSGKFVGIYAKEVPKQKTNSVNLRKFENIVQDIFLDCQKAYINNSITKEHEHNLIQISSAIVWWKMASQGGRTKIKVENLKAKWNNNTFDKLMDAYSNKDFSLFKIGGVRIPTASAFMRFLFPDKYGVMDSRVVGKVTQPNGITTLNLRDDGYINDTKQNTDKYEKEYIVFLQSEAGILNELGTFYKDVDENGTAIDSYFRACDVEMALFI